MAALERVKQDIMDFFAKTNAEVGHVFAVKPFYHQVMLHYNPKEKGAVEEAMKQLVSEGLVEEKEGSHFLTQKGFDRIYD